jgi:hypothetical protein
MRYYTGKASKRRQRKQIAPMDLSIRNFCRECMGFSKGDSDSLDEAIENCPAWECWLYPWRNGTPHEEE